MREIRTIPHPLPKALPPLQWESQRGQKGKREKRLETRHQSWIPGSRASAAVTSYVNLGKLLALSGLAFLLRNGDGVTSLHRAAGRIQ